MKLCQQSLADLPLVLVLSVHTDFLTFKFGKIPRWAPLKLGEIQIFLWNAKDFPYFYLIHTGFFPKILIIWVIYSDFV